MYLSANDYLMDLTKIFEVGRTYMITDLDTGNDIYSYYILLQSGESLTVTEDKYMTVLSAWSDYLETRETK